MIGFLLKSTIFLFFLYTKLLNQSVSLINSFDKLLAYFSSLW